VLTAMLTAPVEPPFLVRGRLIEPADCETL
jgi:hypothetical protein